MFKNFLKITWRSQVQNKSFSFINILGLTIGTACSLLIILWVMDEKNIDNFHDNGDRLYLLYERQYINNVANASYGTEGVLANELKQSVPEIEAASSFAWIDSPDFLSFEYEDKAMKFEGCYADSDYFKMMSYPLVQGNAIDALNSPLGICISEKMANAFFGSANNAIGKTLTYENKKDLKITAVFEDLPQNASTKFDFVINWTEFLTEYPWAKDWGNSGINTIVLLRKGSDVKLVKNQIRKFLDKYKDSSDSFRAELGIQRYKDHYLNSTFKEGFIAGGRIEYVRLFSLVAIFILVVACINFMNLTTARSAKRAKEIGVRKVIGAGRSSLIGQFISEAMVIAIVSVIIAVILLAVLLPSFNHLTGKQISFPHLNDSFWIIVLILTLLTGLLSGSYPAIFLSSFKPITVLKGKLQFSKSATWFRKGLVVFQFTLSIILIIGTIVISKQVKYIHDMNLGYDRENLVYMPLDADLIDKFDIFKQEALMSEGVKMVSWSGESPTVVGSSTWGVDWKGKDPNTINMFTNTPIGYDYVKTLNLELVDGRDFSKEFATDTAALLVNEAALKILGFDEPVGQTLNFRGKSGQIIGVLKDFHFASLHESIEPLILWNGDNERYGNVLIRTEPGKTQEALANLEKIAKELNPKMPFSFSFADEEYQKLYEKEATVNKLSNYFAFLGIFISCLGLFGLAMFTAQQRTKEFGIRKIMGASVFSLFAIQMKEVVLLLSIALFIAAPLAWWSMNAWLQDFAYRINMGWQVFAITTFAVFAIATLTVSHQVIKAAIRNPIKGLNDE